MTFANFPNASEIFDIGEDDGNPWIKLECKNGIILHYDFDAITGYWADCHSPPIVLSLKCSAIVLLKTKQYIVDNAILHESSNLINSIQHYNVAKILLLQQIFDNDLCNQIMLLLTQC